MKAWVHNQTAMQRRADAQQLVRVDGGALDVADLPSLGFGHRSLMWWGTLGLMAIEGTVFALAMAAYFYLRSQTDLWPPVDAPPALLWGTLNTAILLASLWPNRWTKHAAERFDLKRVRIGMVVCMLFTVGFLAVRVLEFRHLNTHWQSSAYGSVVWLLLALHTVHLVTDAWDSAVLTVLMHTGPLEGKRFVDVSENALYWYFVVFSWLPIYAVLYGVPRWT